MKVSVELKDEKFLGGVIVARGIRVADSPPELLSELGELVAVRAREEFPPLRIKEGVRSLLRRGGFKPAGRNKPASEYLAQAAREDRFPRINNLVDINNLISLQSGLPISLLDLEAVGDDPVIRYGVSGEKYIFNSTGQEIELEGLICLCRQGAPTSIPLGNAVKDSMQGKLRPETTSVIGLVYGTLEAITVPEMTSLLERFAELFRKHAGAGTDAAKTQIVQA
jgi:DNA/RNA-binding domain of Phe-tRNA-synthetase-like protein